MHELIAEVQFAATITAGYVAEYRKIRNTYKFCL